MTFSPEYLRIVAHTGNFTLWHYRTDDDMEELLKPDYFAAATATIKKGDVLIIEKDDGHGGIDVSLYAVTDENPSLSFSSSPPPSPPSPPPLSENAEEHEASQIP